MLAHDGLDPSPNAVKRRLSTRGSLEAAFREVCPDHKGCEVERSILESILTDLGGGIRQARPGTRARAGCLPLELSGDAAEKLIDFLYQLTEALERHYSGLLINRAHQLASSGPPPPASTPSDDTPF